MKKLVLVLLSVTFVLGCASKEASDPKHIQPDQGKTVVQKDHPLRFNLMNEPETLDSAKATGIYETQVIINIFVHQKGKRLFWVRQRATLFLMMDWFTLLKSDKTLFGRMASHFVRKILNMRGRRF